MGRVDNSNYIGEQRRRQIVQAYRRGWNMREIAEAQGCSTSTVWRWIQRAETGESFQTKARADHASRMSAQTPEAVERIVVNLWTVGHRNYDAIARIATRSEHYTRSSPMAGSTVKAILQRNGILS